MFSSTTKTARDIMTPNPVTISPHATMHDLAHMLTSHRVSGFPVVDSAGKLVGVISQTDLIRRCLSPLGDEAPGFFFHELSQQLAPASFIDADTLIVVSDIMTPTPIVADPADSLPSVSRAMYQNGVHRIVVVDHARKPIGIITTMDVLKALTA